MSQAGYTPIQLYYSTTASAAPAAGNLANGELAINITDGKLYYKDNGGVVKVLAGTGGTGVVAGSNTQIQFNNNGVFGAAAGLTWDGTTLTAANITSSGTWTISGGTANGVAYLNGSKVLTTGSALTFDGTNLGLGTATPGTRVDIVSTNNTSLSPVLRVNSNNVAVNTSLAYDGLIGSGQLTVQAGTSAALIFGANAAEQMRLTSTGLGIGTSSITSGFRLDVQAARALTLLKSTTGTNDVFQRLSNTGGNLTLGIDDSAGSNQTGTAYAAYLWNTANSPLIFATNNAERARIDSSGNLLLGVTNTNIPNPGFYVSPSGFSKIGNNAQASGWTFFEFGRSGATVGSITQSGTTSVAYNTSSDYRLKEDIQPMTGALAKVAALKPCTYKWKVDGSDGEGFIAHELQAVVPQCVTGEKDAVDAEGKPVYQGIDTSFLVATLTAAIQEQQAIIEQLKARLDAANL